MVLLPDFMTLESPFFLVKIAECLKMMQCVLVP